MVRTTLVGRVCPWLTTLISTLAVPLYTEFLGRSVRQIDDSSCDERAAIIDSNNRRTAVIEVAHVNVDRNRQRLMRRGHAMHIVDFATGGLAPVELDTVPGGNTSLHESVGAIEHVITSAEHHVGRRVALL